ncbi:unnamed protein product [Linum trigynum]|uniref:Secreted protein n=1 Tax=Linum trigynum TaxID=586398 RepID=A0AAV2GH50_9ROSI
MRMTGGFGWMRAWAMAKLTSTMAAMTTKAAMVQDTHRDEQHAEVVWLEDFFSLRWRSTILACSGGGTAKIWSLGIWMT